MVSCLIESLDSALSNVIPFPSRKTNWSFLHDKDCTWPYGACTSSYPSSWWIRLPSCFSNLSNFPFGIGSIIAFSHVIVNIFSKFFQILSRYSNGRLNLICIFMQIIQFYFSWNIPEERYRSPESGSKATINFPAFSGLFASSTAAKTAAPEEIPTRIPYFLAISRPVRNASSFSTRIISS